MTTSYPRQLAQTRRFSLGRPRSFTIDATRGRVLFLRSDGPTDPVTRLLVLDLDTATERVLADPAALGVDESNLPAEERARRERARETAGGIVAYATDDAVDVAAFVLGGQLYCANVGDGSIVAEALAGGVYDVRPDPTGRRIAAVVDGALHVVERGGPARLLASDGDPEVTWGVADFVAAEEMGRSRGYWWSPDGSRLLAARVDNNAVGTWYLADPADPAAAPRPHRYPAAGTANAGVTLALVEAADGRRIDVTWDRERLPYLAGVSWTEHGPPLLTVQDRAQTRIEVLAVDPTTGATITAASLVGSPWLEVPDGTPRWLPGGRLLTTVERPDAGQYGTRSLAVDGTVVTPDGLQVRAVEGVADDRIWFSGSQDDPTQVHVFTMPVTGGAPQRRTEVAGVHGVVVAGSVAVRVSMTDDVDLTLHEVVRDAGVVATIGSHAATPVVTPRPRHLALGPRGLRSALLLPTDHDGVRSLPVILDPYGGPHAQRVVRSGLAFATSQWWADQGFAVLVVDGRGTPGRGPGWEHLIHLDLADGILDDQVEALHAVAASHPFLDLDRVGIRGWSFGGFLAALAVLRRPDVFRCGVAGAPVTDWRLYDTHYTERYLGDPAARPAVYRRSSLVDDDGLVDAVEPPAGVRTDLLVIHGLVDDNVVAAHGLRLSGALLAAGRSHRFLPLSGVTHMTPQAIVAENLLWTELDFFTQCLGTG